MSAAPGSSWMTVSSRFLTQTGWKLVEYRAAEEHGVAQIAYHPWGVALLPVDERRPWRLVQARGYHHRSGRIAANRNRFR